MCKLYLPGKFESASSLYGGIGVAIVSLGWFFIVARSLSLAFAVNAVLYEQYGSITQLVFRLPVLRAIPRRSAWFRCYFGLEAGADPTPDADTDSVPSGDPLEAIRVLYDPGGDRSDS